MNIIKINSGFRLYCLKNENSTDTSTQQEDKNIIKACIEISSIYLYLFAFTLPKSVFSMLHIYCSVTIYISHFFHLHNFNALYSCPLVLTIRSPCLPDLPATTSPLTAPDIPLPSVQDLEKKKRKYTGGGHIVKIIYN